MFIYTEMKTETILFYIFIYIYKIFKWFIMACTIIQYINTRDEAKAPRTSDLKVKWGQDPRLDLRKCTKLKNYWTDFHE